MVISEHKRTPMITQRINYISLRRCFRMCCDFSFQESPDIQNLSKTFSHLSVSTLLGNIVWLRLLSTTIPVANNLPTFLSTLFCPLLGSWQTTLSRTFKTWHWSSASKSSDDVSSNHTLHSSQSYKSTTVYNWTDSQISIKTIVSPSRTSHRTHSLFVTHLELDLIMYRNLDCHLHLRKKTEKHVQSQGALSEPIK